MFLLIILHLVVSQANNFNIIKITMITNLSDSSLLNVILKAEKIECKSSVIQAIYTIRGALI